MVRPAPHSEQKFAPGGLRLPQAPHGTATGAPQALQNLAPSRIVAWQAVHFTDYRILSFAIGFWCLGSQ
jgi:hypothetical protein